MFLFLRATMHMIIFRSSGDSRARTTSYNIEKKNTDLYHFIFKRNVQREEVAAVVDSQRDYSSKCLALAPLLYCEHNECVAQIIKPCWENSCSKKEWDDEKRATTVLDMCPILTAFFTTLSWEISLVLLRYNLNFLEGIFGTFRKLIFTTICHL